MATSVPTTWPSEWPSVESIYRMALALTWDRSIAEELADHAVDAALTSPPATNKSPKGWFWRVLQNALSDRLRRGGSTAVEPPARQSTKIEFLPARSLEEARERHEAIENVLAAVRRLNDDERQVIEARFFGAMSHRAIAIELGMSLRTVERRVDQALKRLRELLESEQGHSRSALSVILATVPQRTAPVSLVAGNGMSALSTFLYTFAALILAAIIGNSALRTQGLTGDSDRIALVAHQAPDANTQNASALHASDYPPRAQLAPVRGSRRPEQVYPAVSTDIANTTFPAPNPAVANWTIVFELVVDGSSTTAWSAMEPLFEPDSTRLTSEVPPRCVARGNEPGRYIFELPPKAGVWLFRFREPGRRATLWVRTPLNGSQVTTYAYELGEHRIETAQQEMPQNLLVLRSTIAPGAWLISSMSAPGEGKHSGHFLTALNTRCALVDFTDSYDPDSWKGAKFEHADSEEAK